MKVYDSPRGQIIVVNGQEMHVDPFSSNEAMGHEIREFVERTALDSLRAAAGTADEMKVNEAFLYGEEPCLHPLTLAKRIERQDIERLMPRRLGS